MTVIGLRQSIVSEVDGDAQRDNNLDPEMKDLPSSDAMTKFEDYSKRSFI